MKCPNCGQTYDEHDTICSSCGQPLSNAHYTPVTSHSSRPHKKKKRKKYPWIIALILLLLAGCIGGYFFYISQIKSRCEDAVHKIFSMANRMDFSSVDSSYLPPALQENPDLKKYVEDYVNQTLEEYQIDGLLEDAGMEIDIDRLCDELLQSATYTITGSKASYNRCEVYVHTENTDFSTFPSALAEEIQNSLSGSSFWDSLKDIFSSIFSGHRHDEEDNEESDTALLDSLYDDFRASAPSTKADGVITFGIADGQWTLLSVDEELFYSYYGLSDLASK